MDISAVIAIVGFALTIGVNVALVGRWNGKTSAQIAVTEDSGFYTWGMLATYAGCLAAVTVVTQFIKPIWPAKIATQFLCYLVAVAILILANLFMKTLTWETAGISVLNAVVVALAANGVYNNIAQVKSTT